MIKAVLFDLDGTLLPMDQDFFTECYFKGLIKKAAPHGYEPKKLIESVWKGTKEIFKNDGQENNEKVFWRVFADIYGEDALKDKAIFDEYYREDFQKIKDDCGFNPIAAETVRQLKSSGFRLALATSPIFPAIATETRLGWTGLSPQEFELITTYENIGFCKPNPEYYREICRRLDVSPEDCLMVGNDVDDDMVASALGMKVFLLTDCLINQSKKDISEYPNGGFDELLEYIKTL